MDVMQSSIYLRFDRGRQKTSFNLSCAFPSCHLEVDAGSGLTIKIMMEGNRQVFQNGRLYRGGLLDMSKDPKDIQEFDMRLRSVVDVAGNDIDTLNNLYDIPKSLLHEALESLSSEFKPEVLRIDERIRVLEMRFGKSFVPGRGDFATETLFSLKCELFSGEELQLRAKLGGVTEVTLTYSNEQRSFEGREAYEKIRDISLKGLEDVVELSKRAFM